jgi:hypothetical protein
LYILDASGAILGDLDLFSFPGLRNAVAGSGSAGSTPWLQCLVSGQIPPTYSGKIPAFARVACLFAIFNGSGSSWTVPGNTDAFFDDCWLFPQWTPAGDEIAKVGSISVTYSNSPLSYSQADATHITWSWNFNASRTDLALSVNNYTGSQTVSGLTAGASYFYYPFIDEVNQVVSMVATGGVGSPSWAHTATGLTFTQEQARSDHWPLSSAPVQVTQPTTGGSGGGSGGGGIGGICLRHDVLVETRDRGVVEVSDLDLGDFVRCPQDEDTPDGWAEVIDLCEHHGVEWVHTYFNCNDWLATTPGHPFTLADGTRKQAAELCFEDAVPCRTGVTFPVSHEMANYPAGKVSVTIRSRRHVFYAGMKAPVILQHNFIPAS